MPDKNLDVLFYVPSKQDSLDESLNQWVVNLIFILEISLSHSLRRHIKYELVFEQDKISESNMYVQFLINDDPNRNSLLHRKENINNSKIINIIKKRDLVQVANSIPSLKDYCFFDYETDKYFDLSLHVNDILDDAWLNISDIAFEIKKVFLKGQDKIQKVTKNNIFFAETSFDQEQSRSYLIREFKRKGYSVVPERTLSNDVLEFSEQVQDLMEKSILSIHILGNHYAPQLDNLEVSKIELQNDIFSEIVETNSAIQRLVFIPPDFKPKTDKQRNYIDSFMQNIELHKNTEIIQTPLEDFKAIIQKRLEAVIGNSDKDDEIKNENSSIYIISDDSEAKELKTLKKLLNEQNIDVIEIQQNKNKIELINLHQRNLAYCDGVIISYSSKNEQWLKSKLRDIVKSPGVGRIKPFLLKAIFTKSADEIEKNLKMDDLMILNSKNVSYLNQLLDKIN
ncbi:MAG: hypothetical protein MI739_01255 [Bacteroidales bacterium]|nr:hypothetical protein [Bacteroidales bacterium]